MTDQQRRRNDQITEWYKRERMALIERLGGRCAMECSTGDERLEIDHINGREWNIKAHSKLTRMRRYLEEEKRGLLQVLCKTCNGTEGGGRRYNSRRGAA